MGNTIRYPKDRFTVTVTFTIEADGPAEAEDVINDLISEGVLAYVTNNDQQPCETYEIIDVEPAEL